MLGRKNYTQEELDHCKAAIAQQLAAYKTLVKAVARPRTRRSTRRSMRSNRSSSTT